MAKFKPSFPLTRFSGTFNGSDRTIGIDKALAVTMRETKNGLVMAKKPISVKNPSLAKKLRVKTYCNCDVGWKTLTLSELAELSLLHLKYNLTHRHKKVKTLYHFWMKICMSNAKTPLINCGAIKAEIYNCDLTSALNMWSQGFAAQYTTYWPSVDGGRTFTATGKGVLSENGVMAIYNEGYQTPFTTYSGAKSIMTKIYVTSATHYHGTYVKFEYIIHIAILPGTNPGYFYFYVDPHVTPDNSGPYASKQYKLNTHHTLSYTFGRIMNDQGHNGAIYIDGSLVFTFRRGGSIEGRYLNFAGVRISNIKMDASAWHPEHIKKCTELINPVSPEE